jgi:hypothetical protein
MSAHKKGEGEKKAKIRAERHHTGRFGIKTGKRVTCCTIVV